MTQVAVIGAGTMGIGIAAVAAVAGHTVRLTDPDDAALRSANASVGRLFDSSVARGKITADERTAAMIRVMTEPSVERVADGAEVVIEAAPEDLELKQAIFARASFIVSAESLLATNTSSLSVTSIASAAVGPERVIGMHFFNPVAAMKLVELVRGDHTSDNAIRRALEFVETLGKKSILVGDTAGFATSRLGVVLGLEAMRMLEQGVASALDIDTAMELGYNHPVGPLRLTDIVGLDVRLAVAERLYDALGDSTYEPPAILRTMVAEGRLGRKSGRGFYEWP